MLTVLLALIVLVLAAAGPAAAHTDRGLAGSNYAGRVLQVSPPMPDVHLSVAESGESLELLNGPSTTVTVHGYAGEKYLRIGPDGVWRNANSPATYLNLRPDGDLPANAEPAYPWHDHRTHWERPGLPPQVAENPESQHTLMSWRLPLSYGDTESPSKASSPGLRRRSWPCGGRCTCCSRRPGCSPAFSGGQRGRSPP